MFRRSHGSRTPEQATPARYRARNWLGELLALQETVREHAVVEARAALRSVDVDRQAGGFGLGQADALADGRSRQLPAVASIQLVDNLFRVKRPIHPTGNDQWVAEAGIEGGLDAPDLADDRRRA